MNWFLNSSFSLTKIWLFMSSYCTSFSSYILILDMSRVRYSSTRSYSAILILRSLLISSSTFLLISEDSIFLFLSGKAKLIMIFLTWLNWISSCFEASSCGASSSYNICLDLSYCRSLVFIVLYVIPALSAFSSLKPPTGMNWPNIKNCMLSFTFIFLLNTLTRVLVLIVLILLLKNLLRVLIISRID